MRIKRSVCRKGLSLIFCFVVILCSAVLAAAAVPGCDTVSIPAGITTTRNNVVVVPINTTDVTGQGVLSFDTRVNYDPNVLTFIGTDQAGTISAGMTVTVNSNTAGVLNISGYQTGNAAGAGVLLKLRFFAVGAVGTTSPVTFNSFMYNEGTPCSSTTGGSVNIISGTITGAVTYANSPTFKPVPYTVLNAAGSVNTSASSALFTGAYTLAGMGAGPYTVTPSKTTDVNGITGFDSGLIAQHVTGLTTLNFTQLIVADVSQNGTVTSFDAALIAQYVANIPNASVTGTWTFSPASRSYANVEADHPNQDYSAYLMGEVSGNWTEPTTSAFGPALAPDAQPNVTVTAPTQFATFNQDFIAPVTVSPLPPPAGAFGGVISYQFDLTYNASVIQFQDVDVAGTISNNAAVTINDLTPGALRIVVFRANPMTGSGTLFKFKFHAVGVPTSTSPLTWSNFMFNEGDPPNTTVNGLITILGTTAAMVEVSGRVVNADGVGIRNAAVELRSATGELISTRTNAFGTYRFTSVESGAAYSLTAFSRGLTFPSRLVFVTDTVSGEDIVANR